MEAEFRRIDAMAALQQLEIGRRIAYARKRAGLTQPDLADYLDVTVRTVQNLEAGGVTAYKYIEKIAELTHTSKEWLLYEADGSSPEEAARSEQVLLELQKITGLLADFGPVLEQLSIELARLRDERGSE